MHKLIRIEEEGKEAHNAIYPSVAAAVNTPRQLGDWAWCGLAAAGAEKTSADSLERRVCK